MKDLTRRQQQVLDFIVTKIEEAGYPPTIREIGEFMGIRSTNGVSDHLRALERKGYLVRDESKSRALRPMGVSSTSVAAARPALNVTSLQRVPMLGRIAAGSPITAFEECEEEFAVDPGLLGRGASEGEDDIFALTVTGESMIEAGILDGDLIFVRRTSTARKGDIVVALIDGEATVKRYLPLGDEIHFVPENASMEPIVVKRSEFRATHLLGKVVGLYRRVV